MPTSHTHTHTTHHPDALVLSRFVFAATQTTTAKDCNQAAAALDGALRHLGGTPLLGRGEANDAAGLAASVDPWTDALLAALCALRDRGAAAAEAAEAAASASAAAAAASAPAAAGQPPPAGGGPAAGVGCPELLVLYGSQTGTGAEIAATLAAAARATPHTLPAVRCLAADDAPPAAALLRPGAVLLLVVSSTGDGEPPDNCARFVAALKRLPAGAARHAPPPPTKPYLSDPIPAPYLPPHPTYPPPTPLILSE